ncbi:MAG: hypothetical protein ACN6PD_15130 [Sphingobacterium sp.]
MLEYWYLNKQILLRTSQQGGPQQDLSSYLLIKFLMPDHSFF